jgi:NADH-quinone oxidoreductase subunit N
MGLLAFAPFMVLLVGGLGTRWLNRDRPEFPAFSSVFGAALTGLLLWGDRLSFHGLFLSDSLSQFLGLVVLAGLLLTLCLSIALGKRGCWSGETRSHTYSYAVLSAAGMLLAVSSRNLLVIFIGVSMAWMALLALREKGSGLKRNLDVHVATLPLMIFALVMVWLDCGGFDLAAIDMAMLGNEDGFIGSTGLVLFLVGLLIQGIAPLILGQGCKISDLLMILFQVCLFGVLVRITGWLVSSIELWGVVFAVSSIVAMAAGCVVALRQSEPRRLLVAAFAAQCGILLLGVLIGGDAAKSSVVAFLMGLVLAGLGAYSAASLGEFSRKGLGWGRPIQGVTLGVCAMSLAGLPPTIGFMGRVQLFDQAIGDGRIGLVAMALVTTAVGFIIYSRIPIALFIESPDSEAPADALGLGWNVFWVGTLLAVVALGVLPESWLAFAGRVALEFF